ncbi:MAG: GAF domain-containing protein [Bacteroidales bacterium]|nr:GAF domain-containing protein [Bacteroidales bacterium]
MTKTRKNRLVKLKLIPRLAILYSIAPLIIFSAIASYIYFNQKNKIYTEAEQQMSKNLNGLIVSVEIDRSMTVEQNNISLNTFKSFISSNKSFFYFDNRTRGVEAINNSSGVQEFVLVKNWKFRGDTILRNSKFISALSLSLKSDLIISQKTKAGYVNVCSTNPRFEMVYFPYSSDIVYIIENGEVYNGITKVDGENFFVRAAPLYVNGKIEGMLISIVKNKFSSELSDMFASEVYFNRGYPFAMDPDGNLLVHPVLVGQSISYSNLYDRILKASENQGYLYFKYQWPENSKGEIKFMMVQYLPDVEIFVGLTFFERDLKQMVANLRLLLILAVVFSSLTIIFSVVSVTSFFLKRIRIIGENMKKLSEGVIPEGVENIAEGEFLNILDAEKVLAENFVRLTEFSENLKEKNYSYSYKKWSTQDRVGDNLIELNNYLKKTAEEADEKNREQERLVWLNEGVSKFIEILKYQVIEIKELAYRIISQIVEYVGANEGGFFIVIKEKEEKYLELLAAYAMKKEKLIERKISFGVGLVGRVAVEKKSLFITEIPDSHTKISTALGQGKPNSIVVLPLIFNDDIIGVIELSSFEVFSNLQLEFLEKITENISANLAMWRASQQTAQLLQATQEQTKLQKQQQRELEAHLKEMEKLRVDSEQREIELNSMIKAVDTTALLLEYDTNGMILLANSRFLETLEKSEEELIGKHHRDITSMDITTPEYRTFWAELLEGRTKRFIESYNLKDKTVWLSQNYVPIVDKDDNVFKILNIAIDVTENKVLERQLRAQVREISKEARTVRKEQRKVKQEREDFLIQELSYKAVIKGIEKYVGHVEFTVDGAITFVNKKFAQILKFDIKQIQTKNIKDLVIDEDFEKFELAIEKVKNGEEYSSNLVLINSENEKTNITYSLLPGFTLNNKVDKIIMIITI